ncbi:MAG: glycerol-3-phosphate acyltransferase [bacterium]
MNIAYLTLALFFGYLCGSIPFSWILVRLTKGIDIRHYGTRTVSGSMVGFLISKPAAALVGILDMLKALLPVCLCLQYCSRIGVSDSVLTLLIGLGAIIGHCWPFWLRFQGGRGVSPALGTMTVLFPYGALYILIALGLGKLCNAGAVCVLIALATMPVLAAVFHKSTWFIFFCLVVLLITVVKRLEANREPLPKKGKGAVLLRRFLLDRDIKDYHAWVHRHV